MMDLRSEALEFYSPTWNQAFYDSIAPHVPGYLPSTDRSTFIAKMNLPHGAIKPLAVLAHNGVDFQDNVEDTTAYQYWGDIDAVSGSVTIPVVKAGIYRLTVYAEGMFGQYKRYVRAIQLRRRHRLRREELNSPRNLDRRDSWHRTLAPQINPTVNSSTSTPSTRTTPCTHNNTGPTGPSTISRPSSPTASSSPSARAMSLRISIISTGVCLAGTRMSCVRSRITRM